MISKANDLKMNVFKDISLLYELSLAIGTSLDVRVNISHFLSALVDKTDINYASVWLNTKMTENNNSNLYLVCSSSSNQVDEFILPEGAIINKLLATRSFVIVEDSDVLFKDINNKNETGIGQYILYKVGDVGFMKMYVPTKNNSSLNHTKLAQLQSVIDKFAVSVKACVAYEKSILETQRRKQVQDELEQSEEKYKTVIDNIAEGLVITDLEDNLIFINEQMCKLAGCKVEDVLGVKVCEAFVPEEYWEEYTHKTLSRKRGEGGQYEIPLKYSDGTLWDAFVIASPYKNNKGEVIGTIGAIIDITKRKKEKQAIIESQEKLQMVLNTSLDAIVTINEDSEVTDWNHVAENIFGYSRHEAIGKTLHGLIIPKRMRDAHEKGMVRFMKTQKGVMMNKRIEIIAVRKSGEEFPVELSVSPIKIQGNFFFSAFMQDITKRKENENALIKAKQTAEKARNIERQFLAHMSHEIRTPMNAVIGMTYLLRQSELSEEQNEYLEALQFSADSLMEIISDILDLSKIDAEEIEFDARPFSLQSILDSLQNTYRFRVKGKNISVEIHIDDNIETQIIGDRTRLNQILGNLLNNASKFTSEGYIGINVVLEEVKDDTFWINFQVYDTGIGISDENLDKIFESFKQASAGIHGEYGGTGLGLSIVKQLVELQGGRISVSSEVEKGTMFEVVLPFKDSGKKIMRGGDKFNYDNGIQSRIQELDILIAEDNPINQKLITSIFMQWGANFDLVPNGKEAIEYSKNKKYDLIFMDINMPVMNGYEAVIELKKEKNNLNADTPIITLTAAALQEERKRMFKAGVFDFITKPFSPKQLQQTIVNCLDKNVNPVDIMIDKNEDSKCEPMAKVYDLSHLEKFSQHNPDFVREMIDMFLSQNPMDLGKLDEFLGDKNWGQVKDIAHQMKSIYGTLGMIEQQNISKDIEHNVRDGNVNLQHYLDWAKQLRKGTEQVYPLLQEELKNR